MYTHIHIYIIGKSVGCFWRKGERKREREREKERERETHAEYLAAGDISPTCRETFSESDEL